MRGNRGERTRRLVRRRDGAVYVEEEDEKGVIEILGTNQEMIDLVIEKSDNITFKPDVGKQKTEKLVKKDKVHFVSGYIWSHVLMASRNSVVGK